MKEQPSPNYSGLMLAAILLSTAGCGGLFLLLTGTRPTLGPRWLFYFLGTAGITGFALPGWVDPEGVSAMVALILKASERATKELDQGELLTATLENEKGKLVFTPIGNKVIVIITTKEAQLGLITLKLEAARQKLKNS